MKLLELLVQELPKRGGWPDGALFCTQSVIDGEVYFYDRPYDGQGCMPKMKGKILLSISDDARMGCEGLYPVFTREQYEAALAAAQQQWNGEGLPPAGVDVEAAQHGQINWEKFKIITVNSGAVFGFWSNGVASALDGDRWLFRPIRSEEDKKRAEGVIALSRVDPQVMPFEYGEKMSDGSLVGSFWYDLYDAIAAGKIPGVKLED